MDTTSKYTLVMWDEAVVTVDAADVIVSVDGALGLYNGGSCVMLVATGGWIECRSDSCVATVASPGKRRRKGAGDIHRLDLRRGHCAMKHVLDRRAFMAWTEGVLLDRGRDGKCLVLDGSELSRRCEAAEVALNNGETVYLTDAGDVVSSVVRTDTGYKETDV